MILGMDWMKEHQAVIQCQERVVVVTTLKGDRISVGVAVQPPPTATVNQLDNDANPQDRVVEEFPDVFPDELPGMPPDRDIEFIIELLPSTTPIAKRPYRMGVNELEKLKKQLKDLQEKGFIHPSSSPWGHLLFLLTRKMVLKGCVLIIDHLMRLPSRTSTHCLGLMIYLIS